MARELLGAYVRPALVAAATIVTTTNYNWPTDFPQDIVDGILFADVAAGTGTSPTLNLQLQTSADGGTTWYTVAQFAQITTTANKRKLSLRFSISPDATAATATNADGGNEARIDAQAVAICNGIVVSKDVRISAVVGGTNPSFLINDISFIGRRGVIQAR